MTTAKANSGAELSARAWPVELTRFRRRDRLSRGESEALQGLGFDLLRLDRGRERPQWRALRRLTAPLDETLAVLHWCPDTVSQRRFARYATAIVLHPTQQVTTVGRALPCGDYGLLVDGRLVASVERKSLADLVASLTSGTLRYQVADLAALPRAAVVVEDRYSRLFKLGRVRPAMVADGLAELQIRWPNVAMVFCDTRQLAEDWTYRFLAAAQAWAITEHAALQRISSTTIDLTPAEVVTSYKNLASVERDFRIIKSDDLDLRPIHHRRDHRVKAHVLICLLACYLVWHLRKAWAPMTFTDQHPPARDNPVAPAQRSPDAEAKASTKHDANGDPLRTSV